MVNTGGSELGLFASCLGVPMPTCKHNNYGARNTATRILYVVSIASNWRVIRLKEALQEPLSLYVNIVIDAQLQPSFETLGGNRSTEHNGNTALT